MEITDNNSLKPELFNSNILYCHVDFDGKFTYMSDLYVGYGEVIGTSVFELIPPEKHEFLANEFFKAKKGQTVHFFMDTHNRLMERENWEVWLQPGYKENHKGPAFVEVYAKNLNAGAENFINSLFKNFYTATDDDLFVLNEQLDILDFNKNSKENSIGKSFSELVTDDDDYLFFLNTFEQAKRLDGVALKITHLLYRNKRKKRRYCRVSVTYMSMHSIGRFMVQIRDIHQEHTNRITLKLQERQFEEFERWRSLGQMSAGIAHEINNPLCIIRIQAEQLKDRFAHRELRDNDPSYMKKLDSIIKQVDRIENIANSLKIYSRSSNSITCERHSLNDLIHDSLGLFQAQTGREIYIDYKNNYQECEIECKKNEFYQIMLNLLQNSYQAVNHFDTLEKCWIKIWVEKSILDQYVVYVQDGGDGINGDIAKDIFTPFFTTKDVGSGTGLGLSISKKLAFENGMILNFEQDRKHTTFSITMGPELTRPAHEKK